MNLKELDIIKEASERPSLQRVSFLLGKIDDKSAKRKPFFSSQVSSMPVRLRSSFEIPPSILPITEHLAPWIETVSHYYVTILRTYSAVWEEFSDYCKRNPCSRMLILVNKETNQIFVDC